MFMLSSSGKSKSSKQLLFKTLLSQNTEYETIAIPSELSEGIKNFEIYVKHNYFSWPYWIAHYTNRENVRIQSLPFILYNNHCRTWYTINSFLNSGAIRIDPCGMIHPDWAKWSVECMVYSDGEYIKFHDDTCIHQQNERGVIKTSYQHHLFRFLQSVYIAHTNVDEAIVINKINIKKKNQSYFIIAIRPYTTTTLSGINSIELLKNNLVKINDDYACSLMEKPDCILVGNEIIGDIDILRKDDKYRISSSSGMATMAFAYEMKNADHEYGIRIATGKNAKLPISTLSVKSALNDYTSYVDSIMKQGIAISIGRHTINEWTDFCKLSTLVHASNMASVKTTQLQRLKQYYYISSTLNRMGYLKQTELAIDTIKKNIKITDDYEGVLSSSFFCLIVGDCYRTIKDSSFVQNNYSLCKQYAYSITEFFKKIGDITKENNFKDNPQIAINAIINIAYIISALENVAFMSRSLGLFGEETKIFSDIKRLQNVILKSIFTINSETNDEEEKLIEWTPKYSKPIRKQKIIVKDSLEFSRFVNVNDNRIISYSPLLYPYMKDIMQPYIVKNIINAIIHAGKGLPLYNTIISAVDIVNSLSLANAMIYAHDKRAIDSINAIINLCNTQKFLPDFLDPVTGHAVVNDPVSTIAVSLLFQAIRNLCFIDHPERLEIFPVPWEEWFNDCQMNIKNAHSRFGIISFTATSTSNEFVIQFTDIPRFIPHDILVNLPFKAKIKKSDDFIVKYQTEKSWCINGWPSEIRFKR